MVAAKPSNVLLEDVEYRVEETDRGTRRSFLYPSGHLYLEYKSHRYFGNLPLLHYTWGVNPETGRRDTARGVIAIGQKAKGYVAVGLIARGYVAAGLVAVGFIACGMLGIGLILGVGQLTMGIVAVGQVAVGALFSLGQVAVGHVAIGQFAVGEYVLAQRGWGAHVWDMRAADPAAVDFFKSLIGK